MSGRNAITAKKTAKTSPKLRSDGRSSSLAVFRLVIPIPWVDIEQGVMRELLTQKQRAHQVLGALARNILQRNERILAACRDRAPVRLDVRKTDVAEIRSQEHGLDLGF